jgi:hypothetical protein
MPPRGGIAAEGHEPRTPTPKGLDMNFTRTLGSLLLLAAFGTTAQAQLTREQVKAELAEAIRLGDMPAGGESGLMLHEVYPARYAKARAEAVYAAKQPASAATAAAAAAAAKASATTYSR